MFNNRPTAVLQYNKLTGRLISKGRDGQFLDIITKSTPVVIQPRQKEKIGHKIKKNVTYTRVISDLLARRTYIAVNEIYLKYYGNEEREFTTLAIHRQDIIIPVPKSAQIHKWIFVYQALRRVHGQ
jgi:hypothetical protein